MTLTEIRLAQTPRIAAALTLRWSTISTNATAPAEVTVLARAAVSSMVATVVDGLAYEALLFLSLEHYGLMALGGAALGAMTNFSLNRGWAFVATDGRLAAQALRYVAVSALTFLGLRASLWLLVDVINVGARIAWLPAKVVAFAAISYPLQRLWVFHGSGR